MRKNTTLMTAAVAVLLACAGSSLAQDAGKVQFRLRLKPGQSFRSETVTRQVITQSVLGNDQKMDQTMGMTYKYEVESVAPDGTATLKVSYDALKMAMDGPTGKMDYDSENPPAEVPAIAKGVAAMLGQSFKMEMNSLGQVTKVEGLANLMDRIISHLDLSDDSAKSMISDMLKKQFGDDAMVGTMQAMMATYPEEPVGVGDTWTKKANVTIGFPMQVENTYTIKSRAGGMATLDVQTKIRSNPDAEPVTMGPMKITYNISGKQSGEMVLHETAGWTMSSNTTLEFKGDVKVSGIPGMAEGTSWPISCTGEATVKTPPPSDQSAVKSIPDDVTYTIIGEDIVPGKKRGLDIRLNRKVSDDVLRSIATKLKNADPNTYDRTFIGYYLPNMRVNAGYWATTHFNPNLEVRILGLRAEQEAK